MRSALILGSLLALACDEDRPVPLPMGGDAGTTARDGGATSTPLTIDTYADAVVAAMCDRLMSCRVPDDDTIAARLFFADAATCARRFSADPGSISALLAEQLRDARANRTSFDGALAATCLATYRASCTYFEDDVDAVELCARAFRGSGAQGASCRQSHECAPELMCTGGACPGTCQPRLEWGGSCDRAAACPIPSELESYASCGGGFCQRRSPGRASAQAGAACGFDTASQELVSTSTTCAASLVCGPDRRCGPPVAIDAPCGTDDTICADGAFCESGVCRAITRLAAGAACAPSTLASCDARADLICAQGMCAADASSALGEPCAEDLSDAAPPCATGLFCDGMCQSKKALGAECFRRGECQSGACECEDAQCARRLCVERGCGS